MMVLFMREFLLTRRIELVRLDSPGEMARFLTADDPGSGAAEEELRRSSEGAVHLCVGGPVAGS